MNEQMDESELAQFDFDMEVFVEMYASGDDYNTVSDRIREQRRQDREWEKQNQAVKF